MIFKPAARYPADPRAVFILALSVFSGITALALNAAPDSLESTLPAWAVLMWGALLAFGSLITLVGMLIQSVNGIIIEQVGCVIVAATTIFYSGVVVSEHGFGGIQTVGIILAWGLSCLLRWGQLQVLINDAASRAKKRAFLDALESQIAARNERERKRPRVANEHSEWRHF